MRDDNQGIVNIIKKRAEAKRLECEAKEQEALKQSIKMWQQKQDDIAFMDLHQRPEKMRE